MTIAPDICQTAIDVVYLLTADPDHRFTIADLDAVYDAESLRFVTPTGDALRPTLVPGISYCATCLVGCDHDQQAMSCEHAGCWGAEATASCPGVAFERRAIQHMLSHDWQLAEIRLAVTVVTP